MPEQMVDLDAVLGEEEPTVSASGGLDAVDEQLIAWLAGRAREGGLQLAGEGGLLAQLTKRLVESALEGEITDNLGYDRHDAVGRDGGDSRNGHRAKTVLTEVGPVELLTCGFAFRVGEIRALIAARSLPGCGRVRAHGADRVGSDGVQIVHGSRRGARDIEHLGSAHDEQELETLKATGARGRLTRSGGSEDRGPPEPTASRR